MAAFGTFCLLIALVVATYGGVASLAGARRHSQRLIDSGRAAAYGLAAILGLASLSLVYSFVSNDYSIKYVHHNSDPSMPLFYKITAYWGGLDGSILWWVFLLSVFSAIAIYTNRHRHKEILPYAITVLMVIADFFLYLIVFHKNPFDTFLTDAPVTGQGMNPLLQNGYMITHPPSLYTGFVGMSIPFAFAMGALISGHLDDAWIASVRRWTLIAWFFLSMGLTLGMLWAYEELGWGGFWGWDPVENAGFLPWLTGTAFLHSVMIQERRGMMKVWNFSLVILTFFLTIFGTFMTRSGVVQSVHAFGQDTTLAIIFSIFMGLTLVVSFGFLAKRLPELRSRNTLDSWLSREGAFLVNNWILVFAAFFVLFATMFPTLSEAVTGQRVTVGPPFFNKWMVPIGLVLLFLTGVGPLIAWRKADVGHLRYQFTWPAVAAAVAIGVCVTTGLTSVWAATLCFAFCAFTSTTIVQEFVRGGRVRKKNTGSDFFTAVLGMILRGRRRYGGYVVHVGIVCMFFGFAGQAYKKERELSLRPGQAQSFGRYEIRFDKLDHDEDRLKEMVTARFTVFQGGKEIGRMDPAVWYFFKHPDDRTTEVAIRRAPAEDLYITLASFDLADGVGNFKFVVNPIVDWIWFGFMLLAFGTGITLLPESVLAPVSARVAARGGAGAAGTAALLVFLGMMVAGTARAEPNATEAARIADDQSWLEGNIMCLCGMNGEGCRHQLRDCGGECGYAPMERQRIREMLAQGKSRDDIVKFFLVKYGGQFVLAAPIDKGFNRLAWALPYGLGVAGAGALAFGAWRFSRQRGTPTSTITAPGTLATAPAMPALEDKLDEELDKID